MIAYCGIDCSECQAFQATQKNDIAELERVAQKWSGEDSKLTAKDVTCDGCFSTRTSKYCSTGCKIRPCATTKQVKNCAYCVDYKCDKLVPFLQNAPKAAQKLDTLHKNL